MKYLLDTNVWIDLERGSDEQVMSRCSVLSLSSICLSEIVLGQLLYGAKRSREPELAQNSVENLVHGFPEWASILLSLKRMRKSGPVSLPEARSLGPTTCGLQPKPGPSVSHL